MSRQIVFGTYPRKDRLGYLTFFIVLFFDKSRRRRRNHKSHRQTYLQKLKFFPYKYIQCPSIVLGWWVPPRPKYLNTQPIQNAESLNHYDWWAVFRPYFKFQSVLLFILNKRIIKKITHSNTYINTHPGLSHEAGGADADITDVAVYRRCGCFCINCSRPFKTVTYCAAGTQSHGSLSGCV